MVNYIAVLVATVIAYIIGMLWYSPLLFGKIFMRLKKIDPKKTKMKMGAGTIIGGIIVTFIINFFLCIFLSSVDRTTFIDGALYGVLLWFGFIATTLFNYVLYEKQPIALYLINSLHYLVVLIISGGILAVWQ